MKNEFIKPEIEILTFLCEGNAADSYWRDSTTEYSIDLPGGNSDLGGDSGAGGDLGVPYQQ